MHNERGGGGRGLRAMGGLPAKVKTRSLAGFANKFRKEIEKKDEPSVKKAWSPLNVREGGRLLFFPGSSCDRG